MSVYEHGEGTTERGNEGGKHMITGGSYIFTPTSMMRIRKRYREKSWTHTGRYLERLREGERKQ